MLLRGETGVLDRTRVCYCAGRKTRRKASRCVIIASVQAYILMTSGFYGDKNSSKDGLFLYLTTIPNEYYENGTFSFQIFL